MPSTYTPAETTLEALLANLEAVVLALEIVDDPRDTSGYTLVDGSDGPRSALPPNIDVGVQVFRGETSDTGNEDDEFEQWLEDALVVRLLYRILPGPSEADAAQWRASRLRVAVLERQLSWAFMQACSEQRIRRVRAVESYDRTTKTLEVLISFTIRRFEAPNEEA